MWTPISRYRKSIITCLFSQVIVIGIIITLSIIITNYCIRKKNVNYSHIILWYSVGHRIILMSKNASKQYWHWNAFWQKQPLQRGKGKKGFYTLSSSNHFTNIYKMSPIEGLPEVKWKRP